jgi:hypothetical protein
MVISIKINELINSSINCSSFIEFNNVADSLSTVNIFENLKIIISKEKPYNNLSIKFTQIVGNNISATYLEEKLMILF